MQLTWFEQTVNALPKLAADYQRCDRELDRLCSQLCLCRCDPQVVPSLYRAYRGQLEQLRLYHQLAGLRS